VIGVFGVVEVRRETGRAWQRLPLNGEARPTALVASPEKKFTPTNDYNSMDSPPGHQKKQTDFIKNILESTTIECKNQGIETP
jgi:hypothetical protein